MKLKGYTIGLFLLVSSGLAGQTWTNLLPFSYTGRANSFHVHQGKLYCGGGFTPCFSPFGNMIECYIASFDGQYWSTVGQTPLDSLSGFGPGVDRTVYVINKSGNNIIVGGDFGKAGVWDSLNRRKLAGFNGTDWYSVYSAFTPTVYPSNVDDVYALQYFQGKLFIGGKFSQFGPPGTVLIASYDSLTGWSDLDGGLMFWGPGGQVEALEVFNNELYAAGSFSSAGTSGLNCNYVAKWDGLAWDSLQSGLSGQASCMLLDTLSGRLYVGGNFTLAGNSPAYCLAYWDGNQWTGIPDNPVFYVDCMVMWNGELYVGGQGTFQGSPTLAKWNGVQWTVITPGPNSGVSAMAVYNGNLIISGGAITSCGSVPVNNIACYGTTCPTNVGISNNYPTVPEILVFPNPAKGTVYIEVKNAQGLDDDNLFLQLFDPQGKKIHAEFFKEKTSFSTEKSAGGIYFVSISDEKGRIVYSGKLVLE